MKTDIRTHLLSTEFQPYLDVLIQCILWRTSSIKIVRQLFFIPYNIKLQVILKFPHQQKMVFTSFFLRTMRHPLQINSSKKMLKRSMKPLPSWKLNSYWAQIKKYNKILQKNLLVQLETGAIFGNSQNSIIFRICVCYLI